MIIEDRELYTVITAEENKWLYNEESEPTKILYAPLGIESEKIYNSGWREIEESEYLQIIEELNNQNYGEGTEIQW